MLERHSELLQSLIKIGHQEPYQSLSSWGNIGGQGHPDGPDDGVRLKGASIRTFCLGHGHSVDLEMVDWGGSIHQNLL